VPGLKKLIVPALLAGTILIVWCASAFTVPRHTRLKLTDGETGRSLLSVLLRDGETSTLMWHNSLFDLDVTEDFVAKAGALEQTTVTFADPHGLPPMQVKPEEVDDFYHTGGPFTTTGLQRRFTRIVYRIGEIGTPRLVVGKQVMDFKHEVGFGGQVILSTAQANVSDFFR
jgi:hypothetical protein